MNEYTFLLPIGLFLLLGVMSPGPSFVLVAHTAVAKSKIEAVAVSLGMGVGATIFAIVASLGLFIVLDTIPWLYLVLKIGGGVYLLFLAFKMWKSAHLPMSKSTRYAENSGSTVKMFLLGLFTQLSNPKTAIVFGSALAAFLPKAAPEYSYYLISLLAFLIDSGWYILVVALFSTQRMQEAYARSKRTICRGAGVFMGMIGIKLLTAE